MLDKKGFDLWADGYDAAVALSDESEQYPFAGYKEVLNAVYCAVREAGRTPAVLDLGFGTGVLSEKLFRDGCIITGVDFSARMIELARQKMPGARLLQYDFSQGLPPELERARFDRIVSTYAMHHLTDAQKAALFEELLSHLTPGGKLVIGDVMFETEAEQDACRLRAGNGWDDDEIYIVCERFKSRFPNLAFERISYCSGIVTITLRVSNEWQ